MKTLRTIVSVGSLAALALGYIGSQVAAFGGRAPEWTRAAEAPWVVFGSLGLLILAIVLWIVPEREEDA